MSISDSLDVGAGLILMYLLLSLVCSAAREMSEAFFKTRAMNLELGIRQLLCDPPTQTGKMSPFETQTYSWFWQWLSTLFSTKQKIAAANQDWVAKFYKHPLISGLYDGDYEDKNLPAYIPARTFALAVMDLVLPPTAQGKSGAAGATAVPEPASAASVIVNVPPPTVAAVPPLPATPLQPLRDKVVSLPDGQLKNALLPLIDAAGNDVAKARENIENWFNGSMDRVSGWYKRHTQWILFWLGFGVTIAMNINTLTVADFLMNNPDARKALVARAEEVAKLPPPEKREATSIDAAKDQLMAAVKDVQNLKLPIGWTAAQQKWFEVSSFCGVPYWLTIDSKFWHYARGSLAGWLVTALAVSFGAPFWFDTLNRVMVVRSTVKPTEKSPDEPSVDPKRK